jgi:hypothetical protein
MYMRVSIHERTGSNEGQHRINGIIKALSSYSFTVAYDAPALGS